jgi:hypothetical protein
MESSGSDLLEKAATQSKLRASGCVAFSCPHTFALTLLDLRCQKQRWHFGQSSPYMQPPFLLTYLHGLAQRPGWPVEPFERVIRGELFSEVTEGDALWDVSDAGVTGNGAGKSARLLSGTTKPGISAPRVVCESFVPSTLSVINFIKFCKRSSSDGFVMV